MLYLLLTSIVLITLFLFLYIPLINPYKFILYIGKKGSGKTTLMTKIALDHLNKKHTYWEDHSTTKVRYKRNGKQVVYVDRKREKITKKWNIYSNVDLGLPGIRVFNTKDLGKFYPESPAVVLIDEINLYWDNRTFKEFDPETQAFFRLQRKTRTKCYAWSQTFDTDRKLRSLADQLWLCKSFGLWTMSRKIDKRITIKQNALDADSQVVDDLKFAPWFIPGNIHLLWIRKYIPYFKSYNPPVKPPLPYHETYVEDITNTLNP